MSLVRSALAATAPARRGADPTLPWGSSYIPTNGQLGFVAAGVSMNDDAALSISTVYRCVQILIDQVSTLPLRGYKRTDDRTSAPAQHPLLRRPFPEVPMVDFLAQVVFSIALRGNFYGYILTRDAKGYATAILPLHPDRIVARREDRWGRPTDIGKRVYRIDGTVVPTENMLHIPSSMVPPGQFVGLNPVEYQRQSWSLAAATEKYGSQFFANSAMPTVVIEVPGDLDENELTEFVRGYMMRHQGLGNAHLPAVVTGGATVKPLSITPEDAQFLATRAFQKHDIAAFFGIPPSMMGEQDRSTSVVGIEQEQMMFTTNTLLPFLTRIETYLSDLMPPSIVAKFDLKGRLRADTLARFQAYQLARNGGWFSVNDIRELEDMPDVENGDDYLQPLNMGLLGTNPPPSAKKPTNDAGVGQGGGNPANSPAPTMPDTVNP